MNRYPGLAETYKQTDVAEGSASYMDGVSSAIAWGGCGQSEQELLDAMRGALRTELVQINEPEMEVFGHDHYSLGLVSGLIMREQGRMGWEHQVSLGERPVDLVVEGILPMAPPENHEIREQVKAAVEKFNSETGKVVDPFLATMADPASIRVVMPYKLIQGAFGTQGFILPKAVPGMELILAIDVRFGSADGRLNGELKGQTVGVVEDGNPCATADESKSQWIIPLEASSLQTDGTFFEISSPQFQVTGPHERLVSRPQGGVRWYCLEENTVSTPEGAMKPLNTVKPLVTRTWW